MQITKEFYAQVLKDYLQQDGFGKEIFICNKSDIFNRAWILDSSRAKIKSHAKMFLAQSRLGSDILVSEIYDNYDTSLFINYSDISSFEPRKMFLEWAANNV